jgi:hypothetical protein
MANITTTNSISGTVIADVSGSGGASEFQRFFNTPEVAYFKRGGYTYLVLLVASGHRPKPLDDTVDDRFYAVRDFAVWTAPADADLDSKPDYADVIDEDDLVDTTAAPGSAATGPGWYINLLSDTGKKQKGFSKAKVYDYVVLFTTYSGSSVSAAECSAASSTGVSHLYAISMIDGSPILTGFSGLRQIELKIPGLPPAPKLLFPDYGGKLGGKVVGTVGLEKVAEWPDRFHSVSWEEVIDE